MKEQIYIKNDRKECKSFISLHTYKHVICLLAVLGNSNLPVKRKMHSSTCNTFLKDFSGSCSFKDSWSACALTYFSHIHTDNWFIKPRYARCSTRYCIFFSHNSFLLPFIVLAWRSSVSILLFFVAPLQHPFVMQCWQPR